MNVNLPNENTLLGAIENYMHSMVHVRPFLAGDYREVLEGMAEQWIESGGANVLRAVEPSWLESFIQQAPNADEQTARRTALDDFLNWSAKEGMTLAQA